jgi:hypothetical protein
MFKPTDRQRSIFETEHRLPDSVRRRLKGSWAEGFQAKVLPLLLEAEASFTALYSDETGRPNWSVARMLGICVLQEMLDLDDQRALDSLAFDTRWQHALGVTPEDSYLSRRSLVDFRSRLVSHDAEMTLVREVFKKVGAAAVADLGVSVKEQRVDSTLIASNIFTRGRVELFRKTLTHFYYWLSRELPDRMELVGDSTRSWYEKLAEGGWFGKVDKGKMKQLTATLAERLYEVVRLFGDDEEVKAVEPYQLVARLFAEHCKVEPVADDDGDDRGGGEPGSGGGEGGSESSEPGSSSGSHGGEPEKLEVRKKAESPGSSLQSPYDPDAGYSYKGPGYLVHVTETCNNEGAEIITDYDVTSAAETDRGKDAGVIDRLTESGVQPERLYEDGGYPTGQGLIDAAKKGTKIIAPMTGGRLSEGTIGRDRFQFDEAGHCTRCPAGHAPLRHEKRSASKGLPPAPYAYFDGNTCRACELRPKCIVRKPNNGKQGNFHLEVSAHLIARDENLAEQAEDGWWEDYKIRSGVEATMSELKRGHGMGKLRVRRIPRVRLAVSFKIIGCNVKRWLRAAGAAARRAGGVGSGTHRPISACHKLSNPITRLPDRSWTKSTRIAA